MRFLNLHTTEKNLLIKIKHKKILKVHYIYDNYIILHFIKKLQHLTM